MQYILIRFGSRFINLKWNRAKQSRKKRGGKKPVESGVECNGLQCLIEIKQSTAYQAEQNRGAEQNEMEWIIMEWSALKWSRVG